MPIPLIVGGIAAAAGLLGVKKAYDAHETSKRAERIDNRAQYESDKAQKDVEKRRSECKASLENLGSAKLNVLNQGIMPFVRSFQKIKNVQFRNSAGLNELHKLNISKEELAEMEKTGSMAEIVVNGATGGVATGALVALGAYGAATTLGVATTGTAISALSGAAATNATLAFLGGGSIAAGGFGIAGGMAVLGSVALGPALAVMGFVMNAKAEEKLENALANRAKAEQFVEQCKTISSTCLCIKMRCDTISGIINKLRSRLMSAVNTVERIVARHDDGTGFADFRKFSEDEQKSLAAAAALAKSIKSILDTPVLTQDGKLTTQSEIIAENDYDNMD